MAFQPREAGEGLTPRSYMPAARLYEAESVTYRGGGHISEVIRLNDMVYAIHIYFITYGPKFKAFFQNAGNFRKKRAMPRKA